METFIWQMMTSAKQSAVTGTQRLASTLCKIPAFNKVPRAFLMSFIQYGDLTGENLLGQPKTTSPATLQLQKYCIQAIALNPEYSSPYSSVSMASYWSCFFHSLLLEDFYDTASLTHPFNSRPLDKCYLAPGFHVM